MFTPTFRHYNGRWSRGQLYQRGELTKLASSRRNQLACQKVDGNEQLELCRQIGNSLPLRSFTKREVMPGALEGGALEDFIRDGASTFHHQTCTASMGRNSMSVVDSKLRVYGIQNLRIADGSIMPRVTTGNTMAPCVIIGERAAEILQTDYKL